MHHSILSGPKLYLAPGIIDDVERRVTVVAVSTYAGCAASFGVLTEEGAFYVDIPGSHLCKHPGQDPVPLSSVVYQNNPSNNSWGDRVDTLRGMEGCRVFSRSRTPEATATYLLTLDWPSDNLMMHVLLAQGGGVDGRLMVWPHHKILWGSNPPTTLPASYRKVRETWRV